MNRRGLLQLFTILPAATLASEENLEKLKQKSVKIPLPDSLNKKELKIIGFSGSPAGLIRYPVSYSLIPNYTTYLHKDNEDET